MSLDQSRVSLWDPPGRLACCWLCSCRIYLPTYMSVGCVYDFKRQPNRHENEREIYKYATRLIGINSTTTIAAP